MSNPENQTILILVISVLIVGTLFLLLNKNKEPFHPYSDVNINKSNMIMNNTDNTYNKENNKSNIEIIAKEGERDNYPLGTNQLPIIPPMIPNKTLDPNAAYQTNKYIRDAGVNNAINKLKNDDNEEYKEVSNAYTNFVLPIDSSNELSYKKFKDFTKEELDESTLQDLYTQMTSSVNKKISSDELERISGKPIINKELSGLYKPVYVSYDNDFDMDKTVDDFEYKFQGFSNLPHGSLI
jgi:hypothetical protein